VHAVRANLEGGLGALASYFFGLHSEQLTRMFVQLPVMVVQLLQPGNTRSASLVTFTVNWHVSSRFSLSFPKPVPDGTRVPWWAYMASFVRAFPSDLRLLAQEVSSTVSL
jgi:hypothetical protein